MIKKIPFDILYEDKDLIAVYKPNNMLSIATEKDPNHNLYHYVREYANFHKQKIFVVHRLDKETSGIVIFAKSMYMKEKLQKAFEEHYVERKYECIVKEILPIGEEFKVDQLLYRDEKSGLTFITSDKNKGKEAITYFRVNNIVASKGSVLDISLETGRQNQIRVALKSKHYTLLGDEKYSHNKDKRMYLNEYRIAFPSFLKLKKNEFEVKPKWLVL